MSLGMRNKYGSRKEKGGILGISGTEGAAIR